MELRAKLLETRDPVALWRDLTTTNRGNCTTRGSDTPMTRRQKASCSDIPDGYPASHADSFDTELGHSPATAMPSTPAPPTPKPKQLARTDADMAGILADVGMLSLLGALAVATRRRGAWPSRPPREDTHRTH